MRPPPKRAGWKWAKDKRELPAGSAEPGPFNPHRAPWIIGITEAIADPRYNNVVGVMGSQMSKTDGCILNAIGWKLDDDPQPILYIGPTKKNTESISRDRVSKMILGVPSLQEGLLGGKQDKIAEKFINGVRLGFGWAGSATELASHPAFYVFIDERDRMGGDVDGEGDVNTLADARTATYDGCTVTTSTPLVGDVECIIDDDTGLERWDVSDNVASPTWRLWQEGSRHEWAWPCPSCYEYFIPRFKLLAWPEESTPQQAFKHAKITCPHCGELHEDSQKEWMNSLGVFVAPRQKIKPYSLNDEHAFLSNIDGEDGFKPVEFGNFLAPYEETTDATFWVSGLCSPWRSYGHRARTFLNAVRSGEPGRIQAAINTGFGELYRISGEAPDWQQLKELIGDYEDGQVCPGVKLITCAVDVQQDCLYYVVRGWGLNFESWRIEAGQIFGNTEHDYVWQKLGNLLNKQFDGYPIHLMLIDSGYKPGEKKNPKNQIYDFCRRFKGWAFPTKGHDRQDKPLKPSKIDVNYKGKVIKQGLQLWHLDSDFFKSFVHARLEWPEDQPGGFHLSQNTDDDYLKQITAEAKVIKPSGQSVWVKIRKDNHYLDCEYMNVAAAHILQVDKLTEDIHINKQDEADQAGVVTVRRRRVRSKGVKS